MVDTTDSSILKNITFVTISRHMLLNIRHQPVKISDVLLLPSHGKGKRRCDRQHRQDNHLLPPEWYVPLAPGVSVARPENLGTM